MEERERILAEAAKAVPGMQALTDRQRTVVVDCVLPRCRPDWNYKTEEGRRSLRDYHQALLEGMKRASRKPADFSKVKEIRQRPKESPSEFLERLLEAYREYTSIDPDDPVDSFGVNMTYVAQSAPDITKKLLSMSGLCKMTRSEILEIAQEVFDSRESEEELLAKKLIRMITAQYSRGAVGHGQTAYSKRRKPLRRDQCAYCKRLGHWKNECPNRRQGLPRPRPVLMLGE